MGATSRNSGLKQIACVLCGLRPTWWELRSSGPGTGMTLARLPFLCSNRRRHSRSFIGQVRSPEARIRIYIYISLTDASRPATCDRSEINWYRGCVNSQWKQNMWQCSQAIISYCLIMVKSGGNITEHQRCTFVQS